MKFVYVRRSITLEGHLQRQGAMKTFDRTLPKDQYEPQSVLTRTTIAGHKWLLERRVLV